MSSDHLPEPALTRVYRLEATLGQPLDLGERPQGQRRIVPLTGGTFSGPELRGQLLPGASADWQTVLPDGTPRRHPLRPADRRRGSPLRPVTQHPARQPGGPRTSRARRGRQRQRVHLPNLNQDRGHGRPTRLAEQGHLHQRWRSPGRRRDLRDLPRRVNGETPETVAHGDAIYGLPSSRCLSRRMFSGISRAAWGRTTSGTSSLPIP